MLEAVLFDLDGTLADTAPDLGAAANRLRQEEGLSPLPLSELRPFTSQGVRGLLKVGFGIEKTHPAYERLSHRFLQIYAENLCIETQLFAGINELLDLLEARNIAWGIVTNKRMRYTDPLVATLGLSPRTPCVVSGDTTAEAKPSALPILHACQLLSTTPGKTLYVGDDLRDIQAGRAAGTLTAAVSYGYLGDSGPIDLWQADVIIDHPHDLGTYILTKR